MFTEPWVAPVVGAAVIILMMTSLWLLGRASRNMSVVDAGWTFGLGFLGVFYCMVGIGDPVRRILAGSMAAFWSLRLGIHLIRDRIVGHPEEGRYVEMRRKWGIRANVKFFWFFQIQGTLDLVLSLPFYLASRDRSPAPAPVEVAAAGIFIIAVFMEGLADRQLHYFKRDPRNRGLVCNEGLWRYSRHPNYFFEWLIWCSFALVAANAPWGFLAWVCPALMLWFILFITGVPPTEAQALRSRGAAYQKYQQTTSVFVPWFPKQL